ncbi:MAG: ISH3 family transposase [Xenococcaceae cyanobacterium MO_188.B29]|nr:ISH3 family transposase [Xenococcaceae cyanobacterium MO_188.B29]
MKTKTEKPVLTDKENLNEVVECLRENIPISSKKTETEKDLYNIIIGAAASADSIENTSNKLDKPYTGKTVRNYLVNNFQDFQELEAQINKTLKSKLPRGIRKRKHKLAIDINLIPYYGHPNESEKDYIYRSQAKSGTCSFYAYATIYASAKNKRLTLGLIGIKKSHTNVAIITYLLDKIDSLKIKFKRLYLDRGFYSASVIKWLMALDIPFIIPAIKNGKTGGINQYLKAKKSYKTRHTMNQGKDDEVTFPLWIVCKYLKGKRNKHGVEYLAFVAYKVDIRLDYIVEDYRRRFGIETSYRLKNICRIRTTTKNPILRLFYVGISFVVVNIWIYLFWSKISKPRRGSRLVYQDLFNLKQMLAFLTNTINQIYGVKKIVYIPQG